MLIVSWNVAGWVKALMCIRQFHSSLEQWLDKHGIDILALQEVKSRQEAIRDTPNAVSAHLEGWESFWCPCRLKGTAGSFNGVATFCRRGLCVSADSTPLGVEEFDSEGRVIMTEHDSFVLFNVYVPNDSTGSSRLPYKMRFLKRLRERMQEVRQITKKHVILAGDLNIARRPEDIFWGFRMLHVPEFLSRKDLCPELESMQQSLGRHWDGIKSMLAASKARAVKVHTTHQGTISKFKLFVTGLNGVECSIGKPCESEGEAKGKYCCTGHTISSEANGNAEREELLVRLPEEMSVTAISDCIRAYAGIEWTEKQLRLLADIGVSRSSKPCTDWIEALMVEDNMCDSFTELHPFARARFTCWDQYKNRRYCNEGARIDYFMVDRLLFERAVLKGDTRLYGSTVKPKTSEETSNDDDNDEYTEVASLRAATAFGRWRMAPFDGSGLQEGNPADYETQFVTSHTGMIYTPPQFSDHIAVSLLLNVNTSELDLATDKSTRTCQPHKQQRKLDCFLVKRTPVVHVPVERDNTQTSSTANPQNASSSSGNLSRSDSTGTTSGKRSSDSAMTSSAKRIQNFFHKVPAGGSPTPTPSTLLDKDKSSGEQCQHSQPESEIPRAIPMKRDEEGKSDFSQLSQFAFKAAEGKRGINKPGKPTVKAKQGQAGLSGNFTNKRAGAESRSILQTGRSQSGAGQGISSFFKPSQSQELQRGDDRSSPSEATDDDA